MQAIILCGGLSERLGKITENLPKILLPIGKRTVLDFQLDFLREAGVSEVILASGHLHQQLCEAVGSERNGIKIDYAREREKLGTGGAIKNAMAKIDRFPFFVMNGDILLDFSADRLRKNFRPDMTALILSLLVDDVSSYGTIEADETNGKILAFREKEASHQSGYVNSGVYLFSPSIKKYFPERNSFSIEREVFPKMENLYTLKSETEWIDVGIPERLAHARDRW